MKTQISFTYITSILSCLGITAGAEAVVFHDFSDVSGLTLNGSASVVPTAGGPGLRLTPDDSLQAGSAFLSHSLDTDNHGSFTSSFSFRLHSQSPGGGDGFVFALQPNGADALGIAGAGLGFWEIPNSFGIEFDTASTDFFGDPNGNHIGLNINGTMASIATAEVGTGALNDGEQWFAWVDYAGGSERLEVRLSQDSTRPLDPLLAVSNFDLLSVLGTEETFAGFTAGTGGGRQAHDILSWSFETQNEAQPPPVSKPLPETGASVLLLGLGLVSLISFGAITAGTKCYQPFISRSYPEPR